MADKWESASSDDKVSIKCKIKDEPMDTDFPEDDVPPAFGPAALGLHRVGTKLPPKPTPSEPVQKLNARGMPARIRKKNRFIFVDDFINTSPPRQSPKRTNKILTLKTPNKQSSAKKQKSPTKTPKNNEKTEDKSENQSPDRKSGQRIGMRLRNLLKLPKAHKWVCFEYFYSNIDKALFDGENDFMICLKESFPQLTNKKLTQVQWAKIRRMMGKPRRCSQAFFAEERKELERKRKLIRYIQQRKTADLCVKDLPNEIPMQLIVGSKVTARLRKPQDGLFTGSIDAVDTSNNTYRITFERPKLGTHSVPDYEVLSNEPPDTICLSSIVQKFRPRYLMQEIYNLHQPCLSNKNSSQGDPMIGCSDISKHLDSNVGSFPFPLLELIVKLTKILQAKKSKINRIKEYNCEAEKRKSFGQKMPEDFEKKYAAVVIDLERMNMDLQEYINKIQLYCQQIAPGPSLAAMLAPSHLREKCRDEAALLVEKNNNESVTDANIIDLITDLTALMLQVRSLSDSDQNAYELGVLQGTMEQIKMKLEPPYQRLFQSNVELHMQRIQMGLGQFPSSSYVAGT
ncbi:protein lin-9 homolog isoform X1 [Bicyclus anynana]|uniref:Protein lin-9 homolog isoform X1 n=2 Tax=Bicyclus anynana TaxID=110368 RepID=A0A6J1NH59_BICAN|nr:protein lin-9 homolog isoform X1 [Bicyclus anynana]